MPGIPKKKKDKDIKTKEVEFLERRLDHLQPEQQQLELISYLAACTSPPGGDRFEDICRTLRERGYTREWLASAHAQFCPGCAGHCPLYQFATRV